MTTIMIDNNTDIVFRILGHLMGNENFAGDDIDIIFDKDITKEKKQMTKDIIHELFDGWNQGVKPPEHNITQVG